MRIVTEVIDSHKDDNDRAVVAFKCHQKYDRPKILMLNVGMEWLKWLVSKYSLTNFELEKTIYMWDQPFWDGETKQVMWFKNMPVTKQGYEEMLEIKCLNPKIKNMQKIQVIAYLSDSDMPNFRMEF